MRALTSYYLTEEEWDDIDATTPEPEPVAETPATETAVTETAVRASLTTPAGTEILAATMAEQARPAPKRPARPSRSRSKATKDAATPVTVSDVAV
ncbi:hypothetical protein [Nonomuraea monospora]|uniref:hypothetical protein n=1 Tax=Nonomuraea monospora TaxID=568818 RepID=UPI0031E06C1F